MHCNYDITCGDIASKNSCCNEVTMWLSHDSSSEYELEIAELRVYYALFYNSIIVLQTAGTTVFTFHSLINIPVS
jgi:hypothetical protein